MALKTYVLLEHTRPTANVYIQPNKDQRIRLNDRILDHAYLRITFSDRDGKTKTIRLKMGCDSIDQNEQIKEFLIPANTPFTQFEKDAVAFRYGSLSTTEEIVQKYLEASPQFDQFWIPMVKNADGKWAMDPKGKRGTCHEVFRPLYQLYDESVEIVSDNKLFKKRLRAANIIAALDLEGANDMLLNIFGRYHKLATTVEHAQNQLVDFLDGANEEGMDFVIRAAKDTTVDEDVKILVGKLVQLGHLDFDSVGDQVVKKVGDKTMKLLELSSAYEPDIRVQMFSDFLLTNDGKALQEDLKKDLEKLNKKK